MSVSSSYRITVKRGAVIHHYRGKALYAEWPDGRLTVNGKRITRAEADALLREARNTDTERDK